MYISERLILLKNRMKAGKHWTLRQAQPIDLLSECENEDLSWPRRAARLVRRQCEAERIVIEPEEKIVFTRTVPGVPPIYSPEDWSNLTEGRTLHEFGPVSNICADWELLLSQGLLGRRQVALTTRARMADNTCAVEFLDSAIETINAVLGLASRYAKQAGMLGRDDLAAVLEAVPAHSARTFREALQSLRLCQAVVWLGGNYHVGLGRFDQYMWPFLQRRPRDRPTNDPRCGRIAR